MMDVRVDLSKEDFKQIGFGESQIWLSEVPPSLTPNTNMIKIDVWGFDLSGELARRWGRLTDSSDADYYVQGWSTLTFADVKGFEIDVALYDSSGKSFLSQDEGRLKIGHRMGEGMETPDYYISCVLIWPDGFCEIKVATDTSCELLVKGCTLIPLREYLMNCEMYTLSKQKADI